jgi:RNA polymerase-binding transcription factor DksA
MTTISTKPTADLDPAEPTHRHLVYSIDERRARWRLALEAAWRRKMDEVIALSKAFCDLTSDDGGSPARRGVRVSSRLQGRTERAYDELVAIEDAIARIDDGTYGMCASCNRIMSDEWLADKPEVRYCPDCALSRVRRQPGSPEAPPVPWVHRARPEPGPGVRRRSRLAG